MPLIVNEACLRWAISIPAMLLAVLLSIVIGVISGVIPAVKAANLNPIDALRRD